jgi:hypothetical protein
MNLQPLTKGEVVALVILIVLFNAGWVLVLLSAVMGWWS